MAHMQIAHENGDHNLVSITEAWQKWGRNVKKGRCRTLLKFVEEVVKHWALPMVDGKTLNGIDFRKTMAKKF